MTVDSHDWHLTQPLHMLCISVAAVREIDLHDRGGARAGEGRVREMSAKRRFTGRQSPIVNCQSAAHLRQASRVQHVAPSVLLIAALVSTYAAPAQAFRTAGDLSEFGGEGAAPVNWARETIGYRLHDDLPAGFSRGSSASVVAEAAAVWRGPACSGVRFTSEGFTSAPAEPGDNINTVQWLFSGWEKRGFPKDSAGATDLLYEKAADGAWHIVEADVYLNGTHPRWVLRPPLVDGAWDLLSVATHEFGHFAGLLHPCELQPSSQAPACDGGQYLAATTMFPTYDVAQTSLEADDIEGICFLYPGDDCHESCAEGTVCSRGTCVVGSTCGENICSEGEACVDGQCVSTLPCGPESVRDECETTCQTSAECGETASCVAGQCVPGTNALGDPCETSRDCAEGACGPDLYCKDRCSTDADCGDAGACEVAGEAPAGVSVCAEGLLPLGATCASAGDCLGQQCLEGFRDEPVCTRLCGPGTENDASCPADWYCKDVDERSVCVPKANDSGCSCSVIGADQRSNVAGLALAVLLVLARRRRAFSHSRPVRAR